MSVYIHTQAEPPHAELTQAQLTQAELTQAELTQAELTQTDGGDSVTFVWIKCILYA